MSGGGSGRQSLDAMVQAGNLAGGQIGMNDALGGGTVDFGFSGVQRFHGQLVVAGNDGFLDLADEGADARTARLVESRSGLDLAGGLLG